MSDTPSGPDWWLGTDGKWYPPVAPADPQRQEGVASEAVSADASATPTSPDDSPRRTKGRWIGFGAAAVVIVAVTVAIVVVRSGGSTAEDRYLEALEDSGLHEWVTDRAAVNAGFTVCDELDAGGPPRGSERDRIAVEHLCTDYLNEFRVLETTDVEGTFTVVSSRDFDGSVGSSCRPSGGYGDINSSTQVVVRNPSGTELARTSLGPGEIERRGRCTFTFEVSLTEGETTYIVEVGSRGEISYSWEQVSRPGAVALVLGD